MKLGRWLTRLVKGPARESELATALDAVGIGWFRSTEDGQFLNANRTMARILGIESIERLRALNATDMHADAGTREQWKERLAREGTVTGFECRMRRADGSDVWIRQSARVLERRRGRAIYEGTLEDVTSERQLEQRLAASEEQNRMVTSSANVGIVSIDRQSQVVFANPAMQRIFGYAPEEIVGRKLTMLMPPHHRAAHESGMARYLATGKKSLPWDAVRITGLHKSGAEIPIEISFGEYHTESTHFFTGVIHDISGQVSAESARHELEIELFHARKMEAVGRLAGGIAHDFNNLLTTIMGQAELALNDPALPASMQGDIEEIRRSGARAAEMTRQLLAFSRKQVMQPQIVDLNEVVRKGERMLSRLIGSSFDLRITTPTEPSAVFADPAQLEQVLMNLVVNARDAMPGGGRIDLQVCAADPYVELTVRDAGAGIEPALLPHIFEPFFTTKAAGQGTGLGLSTVDGIVRQSGGHVKVESTPGQGASFHVFFPRADAAAIRPPAVLEPALAAPRSKSLLLVEDEESVRRLTRKMLERAGHVVTEAARPEAALALSCDEVKHIDVLLTDIVMPGMNGDELARRLLAQSPHLKVVFMSGYAEEAILKQGNLIADSVFLEKPFTREQLLAALATVVSR